MRRHHGINSFNPKPTNLDILIRHLNAIDRNPKYLFRVGDTHDLWVNKLYFAMSMENNTSNTGKIYVCTPNGVVNSTPLLVNEKFLGPNDVNRTNIMMGVSYNTNSEVNYINTDTNIRLEGDRYQLTYTANFSDNTYYGGVINVDCYTNNRSIFSIQNHGMNYLKKNSIILKSPDNNQMLMTPDGSYVCNNLINNVIISSGNPWVFNYEYNANDGETVSCGGECAIFYATNGITTDGNKYVRPMTIKTSFNEDSAINISDVINTSKLNKETVQNAVEVKTLIQPPQYNNNDGYGATVLRSGNISSSDWNNSVALTNTNNWASNYISLDNSNETQILTNGRGVTSNIACLPYFADKGEDTICWYLKFNGNYSFDGELLSGSTLIEPVHQIENSQIERYNNITINNIDLITYGFYYYKENGVNYIVTWDFIEKRLKKISLPPYTVKQ